MPTVRIVCISDTHGQHAKLKLPEGDVLVHAGDFMTYGNRINEIAGFNFWLEQQDYRHKIVIAGNHDLLFEGHPEVAKILLTCPTYLENSGVELLGLRFWGSPVQPAFNNWAFNVERGADIKRYWDLIPDGTDVLIVHGPPHGILDQISYRSEHLGCDELAKAVERVRPKLVIFGHIHGGYGQIDSPDGIRYVNAAVLNEAYELTKEPIVVDVVI